MPGPASRLYAQNIVNLVTLMTAKSEDGNSFAPDFDDEIVAGCCVTHGREVRHEPTRAALEGPPVEPVGRQVEPVETEGDTP
jgi:NAD(P) transhydrogenase subunit alpha